MSALPQIDPAKVAQKLIAKNSDLTYQITQLEVLAETLRDQRDATEEKLSETEAKLADAERRLAEAAQTPVHDITSLPNGQ